MPEMKRTLQAGKMDRDSDEKLVKPGEYREALNVNVGRSDSSDIGSVENILGNVKIENSLVPEGAEVIGSFRDNGNNRIYFFVTTNESDTEQNEGSHFIFEYNQSTNTINNLIDPDFSSWLNFHKNFLITGINFVDDLLFWTDDRNEPRKINVTRARNNPQYYRYEKLATVIRYSPVQAPEVTNISTTGNESSFLEDKFVRFAYRYKFNDGEFSTISPFTPICFRYKEGDDSNGRSLTSTDYVSGQLGDFINSAKQVTLEAPVPANYGIVAVEFLYNESSSTNVYILEDKVVNSDDADDTRVFTSEMFYDSQDPFRALPGTELTRVYDAIPRKAKSQEFAGGRIIYGNYLQNYNLPAVSFTVGTQAIANDNTNPFNRFSVKSRRTYQVGLVLGDQYGRLSPVILSSTGGDTIFVEAQTGADAMQQLTVQINSDLPDWAHSYKVVVKQRQQEYYNWFYPSHSGDTFEVSGNNINKIPRDTTQETVLVGNYAISSSDRKVFPKYDSSNKTSTESLQVSQITYDAAGGANPPQATVYASGLSNGSGVFETSPVESQLDIFYETSTAGLVSDIQAIIPVEFYNCYIFNVSASAHLELNRIRAGFNEPWLTVGLKAFAVQDNFAEQRRFNTLIHSSSFFNSRVGLNNINQFNEAGGGLTISLDPADGSIQKLYAEDTQLLIFQEDKVSRSPIDKDFIFSAEGGSIPVTSSTAYLGTIAPFAGEYGISKNPESFAIYGTRKYFTDKSRGVALRLSNNGITEISEAGLVDFTRDALAKATKVIGSFDEYHDQYNLTIVGDPSYGGQDDTNVATGKDGFFTVSWEEERNGWVSFKSFQQEGGTTLNNRYYTFNGGHLWEHNIGEVYNRFYDQDYESYMEVIFNDSVSDVKEFKTVNYEGDAGWNCHSVETDLDHLSIRPGDDELSMTATVSLNITETVTDGRTTGAMAQEVVVGDTYRWVFKIEPTEPRFTFNSDDATIMFDGIELVGIPFEGSLYFITNTFTLETAEDRSFDVIIDGAASQDLTGALLTVNVTDGIIENGVSVVVPTTGPYASPFRAGPTALTFNEGANNPRIGIEVSYSGTELYELRNGSIQMTSSSLEDLFVNEPIEALFDENLYIVQDIVLPETGESGSVVISAKDGEDIFSQIPRFRYIVTEQGDSDNYGSFLEDGTDISNAFTVDLGHHRAGENGTSQPIKFYVIPEFTDGTDGYYITETPEFEQILAMNGAFTQITRSNIGTLPEDWLGGWRFDGDTNIAMQGTDRNDSSNSIFSTIRVNPILKDVSVFDRTLTNQDGTEVDGNTITINVSDSAFASITNDDVRAVEYSSSNPGIVLSGLNPIPVPPSDPDNPTPPDADPLNPGVTANIEIGDDVTDGTYTMTFTLIPNENYRGDTFNTHTITIIVTGNE